MCSLSGWIPVAKDKLSDYEGQMCDYNLLWTPIPVEYVPPPVEEDTGPCIGCGIGGPKKEETTNTTEEAADSGNRRFL